MRSLRYPLVSLAAAACLTAAAAQSQLPKPYAAVTITRPAPMTDASFTAFRSRLAEVAKRRLFADLIPLVQPQGFFRDRDFGNAFDRRKPAADNFAAAIALEHDNGSGWVRLAEFAAEPAADPLPSRPGVVCAPARPGYDGVAFSRLLDTTYTAVVDWAYPRADATPVRAAPRSDAAPVATLGPAFVRLLGFESPGPDPASGRVSWARIALPDASTGFVAPGGLTSLKPEQLCYIKDLVTGWQIAGYIGGETTGQPHPRRNEP
jgi:hypothetical protein